MPADYLAQRILNGLAQPGVHRALVDLSNWRLLKWLDDPAPFFDWRARETGESSVHPADARHMARMTVEFATGATSGVLRMPANGGGWTPIHLTINRVELDENTVAGLVSLRVPTDEEVASADLDDVADAPAKALEKPSPARPKPPSLNERRLPVRRGRPRAGPSARHEPDPRLDGDDHVEVVHHTLREPACMARATPTPAHRPHRRPSARRAAAASAARSAAACAR